MQGRRVIGNGALRALQARQFREATLLMKLHQVNAKAADESLIGMMKRGEEGMPLVLQSASGKQPANVR